MALKDKYSLRHFKKDFPHDGACLEALFESMHSRKCPCGGRYNPMFKIVEGKLKGRKQFQCSKCRKQISPMAGTIFQKSDTPLTMWFHAIFVFSNAKSGISAKELERQLGVTYKTAWRMLTVIRKSLPQSKRKLMGNVEMDETFMGKRKSEDKAVIIGAAERGNDIRAQVTSNATAQTIGRFLKQNIEKEGTRLLTDESNRYDKVAKPYDRHTVNHSKKEYSRGDVHVNNLEGFWGHVKRSIRGTHKNVSKAYLQTYVDGFVFHRNHRHDDNQRFAILVGVLLTASKPS